MTEIREELRSRIIEPFSKDINCDIGWDGLLVDLHDKVVAIDPNYTLCQVKEKFGGLRFYYNASDPTLDQIIRSVVSFYEKLSYSVCEVTGGPGQLMHQKERYKTLSLAFIKVGWVPVEQLKKMPKPLEG
jgi:hypothetical protein